METNFKIYDKKNNVVGVKHTQLDMDANYDHIVKPALEDHSYGELAKEVIIRIEEITKHKIMDGDFANQKECIRFIKEELPLDLKIHVLGDDFDGYIATTIQGFWVYKEYGEIYFDFNGDRVVLVEM